MRYNSYGANSDLTANQILSQMPAEAQVNTPNVDEDALFYSTLYKNIWGKGLEEKIAAKEAQLVYLEAALKAAPFTASVIQPQIDKVKAELKSLRWKSYYYIAVRGGLLVGGLSALAGLTYMFFKIPSALEGRGRRYE